MAIDSNLQARREQILAVAARHGAREVRVFGSRAHGEGQPDSDVDLLIKLEEGRTLLDIVAIKLDLEDLLGCKVDVVTERAISRFIRNEMLAEAVAL
ncbi:MAG: nucleotidyltransferase family protein [Acidobacteriia bacterium]|nr:nucleotidyltransferase family protein [Terriglobia bacterium]